MGGEQDSQVELLTTGKSASGDTDAPSWAGKAFRDRAQAAGTQ